MVVSDVFANLVSGQEAQREGLIGDGHDVLRVDLVGTVGSDIAGYDNGTNKLGESSCPAPHARPSRSVLTS